MQSGLRFDFFYHEKKIIKWNKSIEENIENALHHT